MNRNRNKAFDLSAIPDYVRGEALKFLLAFRRAEGKRVASDQLRWKADHSFAPRPTTFMRGTERVHEVMGEDQQRAIWDATFARRLQLVQEDLNRLRGEYNNHMAQIVQIINGRSQRMYDSVYTIVGLGQNQQEQQHLLAMRGALLHEVRTILCRYCSNIIQEADARQADWIISQNRRIVERQARIQSPDVNMDADVDSPIPPAQAPLRSALRRRSSDRRLSDRRRDSAQRRSRNSNHPRRASSRRRPSPQPPRRRRNYRLNAALDEIERLRSRLRSVRRSSRSSRSSRSLNGRGGRARAPPAPTRRSRSRSRSRSRRRERSVSFDLSDRSRSPNAPRRRARGRISSARRAPRGGNDGRRHNNDQGRRQQYREREPRRSGNSPF